MTVDCPSSIVPLLSFARFTKSVSSGSVTPSELMVTSTNPRRWCGVKISVPDVAT